MTPYLPVLAQLVDYPMLDGKPDRQHATISARIMAFRRVGSLASWDGQQFHAIKMPVLAATGSLLISEKMATLAAPFDSNAKTPELNLHKLLAGRGDMLLGVELEGNELLAKPEFAGKIEALPVPFAEEFYFLAIAKPYYSKHQELVEKLWRTIGAIRAQKK